MEFEHVIAGIILLVLWTVLLMILIRKVKTNVYSMLNVYLLSGMIVCFFLILTVIVNKINPNLVLEMEKDHSLHAYFRAFPHNFAHFSIWAFWILAILMFISNLSLMKHEGMVPRNMIGTCLGLIFVGGTYLIFLISHVVGNWTQGIENHALATVLTVLINFFFCLLDYWECMMLSVCILGWIATRKKPRYDKDYIIILGCSISKTGGLLPLLRGRTNQAIRYAWDQEIACGKPVQFVPSGGQGPDEVISEGSAMEFYLLTHGAENYEVHAEKASKNTYENFLFSRRIIESIKPDAKVAFSTTNYHVLRSGMLAGKVGLDAEGIGSRTKWYFWPNGFAREIIGIFVMTKKMHIIAAFLILLLEILINVF